MATKQSNTINQMMNIVVAGHVDHGKSTLIGRLLADTNTLPEGKLQQIRDYCARNSKPFEYAFLIDALKDEQSQGITIDSARVFFKTKKRKYIIIDAPGHIEFLKNMVTGASRAEAALLVIDAHEGVQENSYRHGYMLSLLGIKQMAVAVNKIDRVDYDQKIFEEIRKTYTAFLARINIAAEFIPVSATEGDMIANRGDKLDWYTGKSVLETLDSFEKEKPVVDKPFRMPLQDVYKFTNFGDDRRIFAGMVESGSVSVGDEIVFYPSGKTSRIKSIERFNASRTGRMDAGHSVGVTLKEQIYVNRGEMIAKSGEVLPHQGSRIKASLFWFGKKPMVEKKEYIFRVGTTKVPVFLERVEYVINASNLDITENKNALARHEVGECIMRFKKPIAFDTVDILAATSRFVIVDDYVIVGGGIVQEALHDKHDWIQDEVFARNYKWIKSAIARQERAERHKQCPGLILITGEAKALRKDIARALEEKLFSSGRLVYFLGIGSVIHGLDFDIRDRKDLHVEHLRRFAEVANILIDAGMILIVTAVELSQDDVDIVRMITDAEKIHTVWVGLRKTTDIAIDQHVVGFGTASDAARNIATQLSKKDFFKNSN